MTGTDLGEALHAVADATPAPAPDRIAFQRLVRQERRRRTCERLLLGAAVASVAAIGVAAVTAFPGDRSTPPATTPYVAGAADLQAPVHLVADRTLFAFDPQGDRHDLGPAEEVVGWTSESVWYVGPDSELLRRDLANSDEGPGGWTWSEPVDVVAPVQSAQVSADGRWLGWVDLRERLHVQDLKAGTDAEPVQLEGSGYLVDLAQGTGAALVADDRGLVLLAGDGPLPIPHQEPGFDSTATRDLVAVVGRNETLVHRLEGDRVQALWSVPGPGRLSSYGDALAWTDDGAAYVQPVPMTGEPIRFDVPGEASHVAWGDDDTVLVSTFLERTIGVYACDVAAAGEPCAALDVGRVSSVTLSR